MAEVLAFNDVCTVAGGPATGFLTTGAITFITGSSGSGKSRLLRALADLDPCTGSVTLLDKSQGDFSGPQWRSQVRYVAPTPQWWQDTATAHGITDPELAEKLQLDPQLLSRPIMECSSGEQARLALMRAFLGDPKVLLLDEPTANVDEHSAEAMHLVIRDWVSTGAANDQPRSIAWVTHDRRFITTNDPSYHCVKGQFYQEKSMQPLSNDPQAKPPAET